LGAHAQKVLRAKESTLSLTDRNQADVDAAVTELISRYGVQALGVVGDSATSSVRDELMTVCPTPDILLLNGQGPSPKNFLDIEIEDWNAAVLQALTGPLGLVQRVCAWHERARVWSHRCCELCHGEIA